MTRPSHLGQGDSCVCGDRGPITACPVHGRLALDLAEQLAGRRTRPRELVADTRWICPVCPHPSPGQHTHTMWEQVGETVQPTDRECPARARGQVVSVTVPWPLPDDVIDRAFDAFTARGVGGGLDWRRRLTVDVLTAALGHNEEAE